MQRLDFGGDKVLYANANSQKVRKTDVVLSSKMQFDQPTTGAFKLRTIGAMLPSIEISDLINEMFDYAQPDGQGFTQPDIYKDDE